MRKARIRLGLTLLQVADRCGQRGVTISESALSRIERGEYAGRPETREALAAVLGLDAFDDFETTRDEPAGAHASDVGVHGVRGEQRGVPDAVQELPDASVRREAS